MTAIQSPDLIVGKRGEKLTGSSLEWEEDWDQKHHQQAAQEDKREADSGIVQEVVAAGSVHHEVRGVRHWRKES